MISYPISDRKLHSRIKTALPPTKNKGGEARKGGKKSWHERASSTGAKIPATGTFPDDAEPLWNELKVLFGQIQGDGKRVKCGYCERHLSLGKDNLPDGDIDHFRPKTPYRMLAYHPRNYVLSCRVCNETYKRSQFPIHGPKAIATRKPAELDAELPDLVHPLDPREPKLEDLVGFNGVVLESIAPPGSREERRANTMIEIFQLNERDDLRSERAKLICLIYLAKTAHSNDAVVQGTLQRAEDTFQAHFNCALCYLKLWQTDRALAIKIGEEANALI